MSDRTYPGATVPADVARRFLAELDAAAGGELPAEEQAKAFDEFEAMYIRAANPHDERDRFTRGHLEVWWEGLVSVRWDASRGVVFTITDEGIRRYEQGEFDE